MITEGFEARVSAGSLRVPGAAAVFPHAWTAEGVTVETEFTGAHLLLLSAAGCVLNDVYREARGLGVEVAGVRVTATGAFDTDDWRSTGITYAVELDSGAPADRRAALLEQVNTVAEIPRALRAGMAVTPRL